MEKKKKKGNSLFSGMNLKRKKRKKQKDKEPKQKEPVLKREKTSEQITPQVKPDFGDSSDFTVAEDSTLCKKYCLERAYQPRIQIRILAIFVWSFRSFQIQIFYSI